jgi:hypothetical protein
MNRFVKIQSNRKQISYNVGTSIESRSGRRSLMRLSIACTSKLNMLIEQMFIPLNSSTSIVLIRLEMVVLICCIVQEQTTDSEQTACEGKAVRQTT